MTAILIAGPALLAACALSSLWIGGGVFLAIKGRHMLAMIALAVPPLGIGAAIWFLAAENERRRRA